MTIQRGQEWGEEIANPGGGVVDYWSVGGDAELMHHLNREVPTHFALVRGVFHEFLGAPPSAVSSERCRVLPIDVLEVRLIKRRGDPLRILANSFVVRTRAVLGGFLSGPMMVLDNCGRFRGRSFSSRSHPNDGKFDMLTMSDASARERLLALSRMRRELFDPTDGVRVTQTVGGSIDVDRRSVVRVNGKNHSNVVRVEFSVLSDHGRVYIGVA